MSLFVNPAQFGPGEDLDALSRATRSATSQLAEDAGVDLVFAPDADEVYPEGFATTVEVGGGLTEVLCGDPGRRGPGHFRGVDHGRREALQHRRRPTSPSSGRRTPSRRS